MSYFLACEKSYLYMAVSGTAMIVDKESEFLTGTAHIGERRLNEISSEMNRQR